MSIPNTYKEMANGKFVDIANPSIENLDMETLFKQLSLINRFNGATYPKTVSVLEHSINVSLMLKHWELSVHHQLYGLVHDAHEAVIGDIATPVKAYIGIDFFEAKWEDAILDLVGRETGLWILKDTAKDHNFLAVKDTDRIVTRFEAVELMPSRGREWGGVDDDKYTLIEYVEFNEYRYGSQTIGLCGCDNVQHVVETAMDMYNSFIDPASKYAQEAVNKIDDNTYKHLIV